MDNQTRPTSCDFDRLKNRGQMRPLSVGLKPHFLINNWLIPLALEQGAVVVGALQEEIQAFSKLRLFYQKPILPLKASGWQIKQCLQELFPQVQRGLFAIEELFSSLLHQALALQASDIHIEPMGKSGRIRLRVDGVLQELPLLSSCFERLVAHIKVLSQLDIAEQRLPQEGRLRKEIAGRRLDLRVSVLPVYGGERVVLRILDQSSYLLTLEQLQLGALTLPFKRALHKSEGLVLVTGPTGSGKTTTLYSALDYLNSLAMNIMTIEDPIEYRIEGIAQLAVRPKIQLDFANGLRYLLRQDPDVILIGEIRDKKTAKIAIQAALTGHLVLSTLHTQDAAGAITRLVELGIARYLLCSCLIGVLAQRLVRLICSDCKTGLTATSASSIQAAGCSHCFQSGYRGRRAIFEWLELDQQLRRCLLRSPETRLLRAAALARGMQSLQSSASHLVEQGLTSRFEVRRVLG